MKIGILTFHRCINYGSYWQTRCLAEGLQSRGHEVEILDHQSSRVNFAEWKCALQPVLPTQVPSSDYLYYRHKIIKFFCEFESLPLSAPFPLSDPSQMDDYDLIVVGSDEVWNLAHPWYRYCSLFYGDGLKAKSLVSYAASFGNYDSSWGLKIEWAKKLHQFDKISVRDENSKLIIKNSLGIDPEIVLDPCLQFPINYKKKDLSFIEGPYAAVYGHNFSDFFIHQIKQWAKEKNLPLISIGYRNDWADKQWITADPHDYATFMANATAVITNFFHGCVFALINSKPFVCETSNYRSNKVQGLMKTLGGEKHLASPVSSAKYYHSILEEPISVQIHENIVYLRKISNIFLDQVLVSNLKNYYESTI